MLDPLVSGPRLCHEDVEALVTDGANAICERFAGTPSIALTLGLVIAAAFAWRTSGRWRNRLVVATVALSLPGLVALAARRADSPGAAATTAARLAASERAIEEEATATGCAPSTSPCPACEPIARYARARTGACRTAGAASAEGAASAAARDDRACDVAGRVRVCGAP